MKKVIGITGGIASGKSVVSNYIKQKYQLFDCDMIAHDVFDMPSTRMLIANTFNINISDVTRSSIGKIVFNDKDKLISLNNIMQPLIQDEMKKVINDNEGLIFIDIPLLYDLNLEYMVDKIIFVYTDEYTQLDRLMKRDNISKFYAINKISSQLSMKEKMNRAINRNDYIIDNSKTKEELYKQVDNVLKEITYGF